MMLDKYQQAVIDAPADANLKVIGVPGSGKTRTLVNRYWHLYTRCGIKPSRILCLTFSKKAADEMAKRISAQMDLNNTAKSHISTINAFCYRAYNDWRVKDGKKPLEVWNYGHRAKNPMYVASELLGKYMGTNDLSIFDYINKTFKSYPDPSPKNMVDRGHHTSYANNAYNVWCQYETYMKENNLVDFPGQVWNIDRLIYARPIFSRMLGSKFDKIICDETQDMFAQTYRILLKLSEVSSLELYGDPSQSIYGFNGAAPHLLEEIQEKVPNMLTFYLLNNYRSKKKVVDVVNNFGPNTSENFQPMICASDDESIPGVFAIEAVETIADQADLIADEIQLKKYNPADVYVLARTNSECSTIYQRLIQLGVPANYAANFSIWDKSHIKAAIGYMAIANSQDSHEDLESVLNIPSENFSVPWGPSKGKYSPSRFLARKDFAGHPFKSIAEGIVKLTRGQSSGVNDILSFVRKMKEMTYRERSTEVIRSIVKWAQYAGLDPDTVDDDLSFLFDKLENVDYDVNKLRLQVRKIKESKRKIKADSKKVEVMTIHQAKGLEAPVVFLVGVAEPTNEDLKTSSGFSPLRNTNPHINEENCLFYVGISRAMENLYLIYYRHKGENLYTASSFVNLDILRMSGQVNYQKQQT